MKKNLILSAIVALMLDSCGGSISSDINKPSSSIDNNDSLSILENIQNSNTYQTVDKNIDNIIIPKSTYVSSIKIIQDTLSEAGYSVSSLVAKTSKNRDLDRYIYISDAKNSINVLGDFVCVISDANGKKILATLDAPKDFDHIEKNSELVLKGNLLDDNSRYRLSFIPTGFVNLNTTNTNPNATISSLIHEIINSFNQFTIVNPKLLSNSLAYKANSRIENITILCNEVDFILDSSKGIINFDSIFQDENSDINCSTKSGILLGSIVGDKKVVIEGNISIPTKPIDDNNETQKESTRISGDLYRRMFENYERTEGDLATNKPDIYFINKIYIGQFGQLEISSDGHWVYKLNINMDIIKALKDNQFKEDKFNIQTTDGIKSEIVITIDGKDTIIKGELFNKVMEYNKLVAKGKIFIEYGIANFIPKNDISTRYGFFSLDSDGNWEYRLNMDLVSLKKLKSNDLVKDILEIQTTDDTTSYITIDINGVSRNLIVNTFEFDKIPQHFESKDNLPLKFKYPTISATGDYPFITNSLNHENVNAGEDVLLYGGINFIKINIDELYGEENLTLSKEINVSDTIAPIIKFLSYKATTYQDITTLYIGVDEPNTNININNKFILNTENDLNATIELNTSGDIGIKEFNITVEDLWGNESNSSNIEIERIIYNPNLTDFSDIVTNNVDSNNGRVEGEIRDDDNITSIKFIYSNGDTHEGTYNDVSAVTLDEPSVAYGTTVKIEVTDSFGNVQAIDLEVREKNIATDFSDVAVVLGGVTDTVKLDGEVRDDNGINSMKVSYSDETETNYTNGTLEEEDKNVNDGISVTIDVVDGLGNHSYFSRPLDYDTDFSDVKTKIDDTNTSSGYIYGSLRDEDGIDYIYIEYDNNETADIYGEGKTQVGLNDLAAQPVGTKFTIYINDMLYRQEDYSGTIE